MALMSSHDASEKGAINFESLKSLVALQESQPSNLIHPSQLTPAQLRAVTELNRATHAALQALFPPVTPAEPELGDKDWISLLQRYRDAHPDGTIIIYTEESQGQKWCCFTKIAEAGDLVFPAVAVPFSRKKDAKKYAAHQAVEWLMAKQLMPNDCENVTFKKAKEAQPRPSTPLTTKSVATTPSTACTSAVAMAQASPKTPQARADKNGSQDDANEDSVVIKVEKMCRSLTYGLPRYEITPVENSNNLFNGKVDWGDEDRVPGWVGVVQDIFGKKNARDLIAKEVLSWMTEVKRKRSIKKANVLRNLEMQNSTAATTPSS